jgi:shikimate dehydrogenase
MSHPDRFLLAGVMGWPVMHSRSPRLHNYWLGRYGLVGAYVPLAIHAEGLRAALRALPALGFSGCNLTIPHKEAAFEIVDEVDPPARRIGAINCVVVRPDGSLFGRNHDGWGYIESIIEAAPEWRADAGPIVVLGAGGGARAVVAGLADRGAEEIRVVNRSFDRARQLERAFGAPVRGRVGEPRRSARRRRDARQHHEPGHGRPARARHPLDRLPKSALISDIIYIPKETPLLAAARVRGNQTVNGLGMLLHQARPAFRDWFGVMPEVTPELRAMIEATI